MQFVVCFVREQYDNHVAARVLIMTSQELFEESELLLATLQVYISQLRVVRRDITDLASCDPLLRR